MIKNNFVFYQNDKITKLGFENFRKNYSFALLIEYFKSYLKFNTSLIIYSHTQTVKIL
jgi:hypothetical protein